MSIDPDTAWFAPVYLGEALDRIAAEHGLARPDPAGLVLHETAERLAPPASITTRDGGLHDLRHLLGLTTDSGRAVPRAALPDRTGSRGAVPTTAPAPGSSTNPPMRGDDQGWESGPALRRHVSGERQRLERLDPVPPTRGKGTPAAQPQWLPAPTQASPPVPHDPDRTITDGWWDREPDPAVPPVHILVWAACAALAWALLVLGVWGVWHIVAATIEAAAR